MLIQSIEDVASMAMKEKVYLERLENIRSQLEQINLQSLEISEADKFDKYCDPDRPVKVTFNDISAAAYRIKGGVYYTPCDVILTQLSLQG